jgi:hypothetical protein
LRGSAGAPPNATGFRRRVMVCARPPAADATASR